MSLRGAQAAAGTRSSRTISSPRAASRSGCGRRLTSVRARRAYGSSRRRNGGSKTAGRPCGYAERLWGQDDIEAERRETAIKLIRDSTDNGTAAVAWDISGCEWGLVTGYDDDTETFATLRINGQEDTVRYEKLGRLELPILSVLTVTGKAPEAPEQLVADTKALAKDHLLGNEWCDNAKGLAAYDTIMSYTGGADAEAWKLMYTLGTYAALKSYAVGFFPQIQ